MLGGTNPALRTFYYRLLRLISLSIHPLFVFDGPNKPPFKRNKRTGPNVASIPEFLAKQLLKQFGLPFHLAPGEAEAECALLQREGIVDAVLSEDVDTLMFGSGLTFRSWTPEVSKSKTPTHINLYDAKVTKETSGMDREGMILVALMSGGDYVPEGIPGCGPKTACEAARAGFGHDLCQISRRDKAGLRAWKEKMEHELHTNESKHFRQKHGKLKMPEDFPNPEVLGYYTHPVLSSTDKLDKLRRTLKWDMDIDFRELRTFTGDAFDWTKLGGAKKFIRNLAPALLVRELRMRAEGLAKHPARNTESAREDEGKYISGIHGKRNHGSTDGVTELRISFKPHDLVPIDLDDEEPDDEINNDSTDDEGSAALDMEAPGSPSKKRAPSNYDPTQMEKLWIFETYVKAGAPLIAQEWEDRAKNARILVETRNANREAKRAEKEKTNAAKGGMQRGPLDRFAIPSSSAPATMTEPPKASQRPPRATQPAKAKQKTTSSSIQQFAKVTKPGISSSAAPKSSQPPSSSTQGHRWLGGGRLEVFQRETETIDLLSSSPAPSSKRTAIQDPPVSTMSSAITDVPELLPPSVAKRRRSPLRRWATDTAVMEASQPPTPSERFRMRELVPSSPSSLPSPSQLMPAAKKSKASKAETSSQMTKPSTPKRINKAKSVQEPISIVSSSPSKQSSLYEYFTPRRRAAALQQGIPNEEFSARLPDLPEVADIEELNMTGSPTPKASQRPGRRVQDPPRRQISPPAEDIYAHGGYPHGHRSIGGHMTVDDEHLNVFGNGYLTNNFFDQDDETMRRIHGIVETGTVQGGRSVRSPPREEIDLSASSPPAPLARSPPRKPAAAKVQKKQVYRVRESLPGAFAIEELDMTKDIGVQNVLIRQKKGKTFRMSGVGVLDLTGD